MGSCWVTTGSVLLAVGMALGITCIFSPYWHKEGLKIGDSWSFERYYGMLGECGSDCDWWWENDGRQLKNNPDWLKAATALFCIGVICLVVAELTVICYSCCGSCQNSIRVTQILIGCLVIAAIALGISVTVYGAKYDTYTHGARNAHLLYWAFYLAAASAICTIVAAIIFLCECCRVRRL